MRPKTLDAKLTNLFLDMLAAEQGAGDNTLDAYRRDLEDFSEFAGRAGSGFAAADTQLLRDYLEDLDSRGFKSTTVARRLSALRHLFRFLLNERLRTDDPAAILSGPKRGRGLPKVLSISDVDRMLTRAKELTQAPETSAPQRLRAMRLYCLLEVLYATGLRVSELVALPRAAARRDARLIVVRGKGDKERLVPLNEISRQAMADYLAAMEALKARKKNARISGCSLVRRERTSDAAAFRARPQGTGGGLRPGAAAGQPACAAPCLRQSPAAQRRRSAHRADAARPYRYLDHADLHPCGRGAPEKPGA
jgi:integrase/recombinase XerD